MLRNLRTFPQTFEEIISREISMCITYHLNEKKLTKILVDLLNFPINDFCVTELDWLERT